MGPCYVGGSSLGGSLGLALFTWLDTFLRDQAREVLERPVVSRLGIFWEAAAG